MSRDGIFKTQAHSEKRELGQVREALGQVEVCDLPGVFLLVSRYLNTIRTTRTGWTGCYEDFILEKRKRGADDMLTTMALEFCVSCSGKPVRAVRAIRAHVTYCLL